MIKNLIYMMFGFMLAIIVLSDGTQKSPPSEEISPALRERAVAPPALPSSEGNEAPERFMDPKVASRATPSGLGETIRDVAEFPDDLVEPAKRREIFSGTRFVNGTRVNFRAGPSLRHEVVGTLTLGAKISPGTVSGNWTQIKLTDGRVGWMASRYLSPDAPPEEQQPVRSVAVPTSREITAARKAIIRQSIAAYPGSCACPYNSDRAGRRCGKRSAWSRQGGYAPMCYDSDISQARLDSYFARLR